MTSGTINKHRPHLFLYSLKQKEMIRFKNDIAANWKRTSTETVIILVVFVGGILFDIEKDKLNFLVKKGISWHIAVVSRKPDDHHNDDDVDNEDESTSDSDDENFEEHEKEPVKKLLLIIQYLFMSLTK